MARGVSNACRRWSVATAVVCFLGAGAVEAAVHWGVRGGVYADEEDLFIGGEALWNVGRDWRFNPNLEFVFVERGDLMTLNADFQRQIHTAGQLEVWAGVGPAIVLVDRDFPRSDDEADPGVNLMLGVGTRRGDLRPYGQVKILLSDDSQAVFGFGVRF